jgi:hypothetical protein
VESEVVKNSRLTSENEQLREQLEQFSKDATSITDVGPAPRDTSVSGDEHGQLTNKYDELSKKYQDLTQKIKYLERKNTAVMQKNKDMKESVRAWQEYADRQSGKQKPKGGVKVDDDQPRLSAVPQIEDTRPHMPSSPRSVTTARTPVPLADTERSSPASIAPLAHAEIEGGHESVSPKSQQNHGTGEAGSRSGSVTPRQSRYSRSSPRQPTESHDMPHLNVSSKTNMDEIISKHFQTPLKAIHPSSSQTTEDEHAEQIARQTQVDTVDDDSEMPQFVSERSLKRKRGQASKFDIWGDRSSDGTPVKPFRVKDEPLSSPPATHSLMRKDTIDLDDPTSAVLQTPRHTRPKPSLHSTITGTVNHQRSSSAPFSQAIKQEASHLVETSNVPVQLDKSETTSPDTRAHSEPSDTNEKVPNVLQHLDANVVSNPSGEPTSKRAKRAEVGPQKIHNILSESGEEPPPPDENARRLAPGAVRAKLNRKLHQSTSPLHTAMIAHQTTTPTTTRIKMEQNPTPPSSSRTTKTPIARTTPRGPQSAAHPDARSGPATDDRPQWRMRALEPRSSTRKPPVSPTRNQGRLRSRPVTELTLQDFKVNPVYNQGYSHAFSETVRKRGDRMCLPGCTNPQCCGSTFRTLAEAQGSLPFSQEEALLEDYLGDAYDNMNMTQMSSEERQELVLQARTKKMAKETGKHREAWERRRTPPGFWRVDFPTTQEQQEDRERSKEQEKKAVQERWLEAQRKGGKWIFRDE